MVSSSLLVAILYFCLHLYNAKCQTSGSVLLISREGDTMNQIVLRCRSTSKGTESAVAIFREYNSLALDADFNMPVMGTSVYRFNVTHTTERIVTCKTPSDIESVRVVILAAPEPFQNDEKVLARKGETVLLTCPFPLGNLHDLVTPYEHSWITNRRLPNNSTILSVPIDSSTPDTYMCSIRMRLCSICVASEQPSVRSDRFRFELTLVDPISNVMGPEEQNVTEDSHASFECSANGTNVEIIWYFNGSNYSRMDMCSDDVCVVHSSMDTTLTSTLTVKANRERNQSVVTCFIRQAFDGSIPGLNNADFGIGVTEDYSGPHNATLIVTDLPPTTPTSPTLPTTIPTTPGDQEPILYASLIVSVVVIPLAIVIIIIVVLYFCHVHYRGKNNPGKVGRALSRAFTRSTSSRGVSRNTPDAPPHIPTSKNGVLDPSLFRACPSFDRQSGMIDDSHSKHAVHSNGNGPQTGQDPNLQEQIYNTSQHSGASGASGYSGLSGVSNQVPGVVHKMPPCESGTDISGGSFTNNGQVNGGHLAPPNPSCNGSSRSRKSSDGSGKSYHSHHSSGASIHNGHPPVHHLSDRIPVSLPQYQYPDNRGKAASYHHIPGYQYNAPPVPMFNPHHYQDPRYHSDSGFVTHSHPQLYNGTLSNAQVSPYHLYNNGMPVNPPIGTHHSPAHSYHGQPYYTTQPVFEERPQTSGAVITDTTVKLVMDSLMHNRNCRIPDCPCYTVRKRYSHLFKEPEPLATQSSSGSDSDTTTERRMRLRLPLASDDVAGENHPHYHITKDTRPKRVYPKVKVQRRRSKSVDLTPVQECSETPLKTPRVGGTLLAETPVIGYRTLADAVNRTSSPCNPIDPNFLNDGPCTLLQQRSISADNLPTLCLNDCPFTPSPMKENKSLKDKPSVKRLPSMTGKPELSTIGEKRNEGDTDASNTSSRSDSLSEPAKSSLSDNDEAIEMESYRGNSVNDSITSTGRDVGLVHWDTIRDGKVAREISHGYYSMTSEGTENSLSLKRRLEPNSSPSSTISEKDRSHRSNSPAYSTVVTLSDDGNVLHTTEC